MASVKVPKDLSGVSGKLVFGLTLRQLVCFGGAGLTAAPLYFLVKDYSGDVAAALMFLGAIPWMFLALYKRDGLTAERLALLMYRHHFWQTAIRPYREIRPRKERPEGEPKVGGKKKGKRRRKG